MKPIRSRWNGEAKCKFTSPCQIGEYAPMLLRLETKLMSSMLAHIRRGAAMKLWAYRHHFMKRMYEEAGHCHTFQASMISKSDEAHKYLNSDAIIIDANEISSMPPASARVARFDNDENHQTSFSFTITEAIDIMRARRRRACDRQIYEKMKAKNVERLRASIIYAELS